MSSDALEQRLDLIASLVDGWDGGTSIAPPASTVDAVRGALATLDTAGRERIECSAHGDGYLALTISGELADDAWMADVHETVVVYEHASKRWTGDVDVAPIRDEIRRGLAATSTDAEQLADLQRRYGDGPGT